MVHSLKTRLVGLWLLSLIAAVTTGFVLVELYRQSAAAQVSRAEAVVARACGDIADRYAFYVAGWRGPVPDLGDPQLRRDLTSVVEAALAPAQGVEGGVWLAEAGSLAYGYPTYEGTGPKTDVPEAELPTIRQVNASALAEQRPVALRQSGRSQVLLIDACPLQGRIPGLTAWTMTRVFTGAGHTYNQLLIGLGVLLVTIVGSAALLGRLLFTWSRQLTRIEAALARGDVEELPALDLTGEQELDRIIRALNGAGARLREARRRSTELTRRAAAAERLAVLGRVAAGIAHEIRNPIAAMRLKAENALAGNEDRRRGALDAILRQVDRLDGLLRDLLTMTNQPAPQPRPVELPRFLEECVEAHRELAAARGVALATKSPEMTAVLDPAQIRRALDNLILNALQNTPSGGVVRVIGLGDDDRLRLRVADTGAGVPAGLRAHVFEPFVTGRPEGVGLGLAIVREIAAAHGGEVRLLGEGKGTTFEIELPWRPS